MDNELRNFLKYQRIYSGKAIYLCNQKQVKLSELVSIFQNNDGPSDVNEWAKQNGFDILDRLRLSNGLAIICKKLKF